MARRQLVAQALVAALGLALLLWAACADAAWMDRHLTPSFHHPRETQLRTLLIVRLAAAFAGVVALTAGRALAGRIFARRTVAQALGRAAPTLVAVALALGASELILRLAPGLDLQRIDTGREPLRRPDPVLGWDYAPGRTAYGAPAGRRVAYALDPAGFRVARGDRPVDPSRPTILFAGESFMLGQGLDWAQTIPAQVEAATGLQSANLGVEGYGTDQSYLRLRRVWPAFQRPAAVVFLVMPSIFARNLDTDRPHLTPGLTLAPPDRSLRLVQILRRAAPYRTQAEIDRGVAMTREVLAASAAMARARGAAFLVVVPQPRRESLAERALRRRVLDAAGLPYVLVPLDPAWRLPGNRHPDARGAQAIAQAIVRELRARDPRFRTLALRRPAGSALPPPTSSTSAASRTPAPRSGAPARG